MRNKLKFLSFFIIASIFFTVGCKKDYIDSKETFLPELTINGDAFIIQTVGEIYVDAGAVATAAGQEIDYTTTGTVDYNVPDIYTLDYEAFNEDGFSVTTSRQVLVVDTLAADEDYSGSYQRGSNTPVTIWTKDGDNPYLYHCNNPGGVPNNAPFNVNFDVYCVEPGIVIVPLQQSGVLAPFYCTDADDPSSTRILFNSSATVGQVAYEWYVNGANFSYLVRTFKKL
ncbi:MAG: DUF5011 domain-containing protein [Chitinophagales bacterium]|nr:DUF5011 domain-containing protein [Chitinophagales bacterium]